MGTSTWIQKFRHNFKKAVLVLGKKIGNRRYKKFNWRGVCSTEEFWSKSEPKSLKKLTGTGTKKKFHRDRDRDRDQKKIYTGTGTGTEPIFTGTGTGRDRRNVILQVPNYD